MKLQTIFHETGNVRVVRIQGETWFVLKDVLVAIETKRDAYWASKSIEEHLGKGAFKKRTLETAGGKQELLIINESALTFLLSRSNTEAGKRLNRFIHVEVLPTIRKKGRYELPERDRSRQIRNTFTDALQAHGCSKPGHFIGVTNCMKQELEIEPGKKKDDYDRHELALTIASEMISTVIMDRQNANGYFECKAIGEQVCRNVVMTADTQVKRVAS